MIKNFKFLTKIPSYQDDIPEGFAFAGVTPTHYSPYTFTASKFILLRDRATNTIAKGQQIFEDHILWNYIDNEQTPI